MKKLIITIAILAGAGQVVAQTNLATAPLNLPGKTIGFQDKGSYEIGFFTTQVKGVQFADFDISDCSIYGLKAMDSNSKESRYRIPLGELAQNSWQLYGFQTAIRWNYARKVQGGFAMRAGFGKNISIAQASLLVSPQLYSHGRFRITGELELGGTASSIKVNNAQPLAGYHQYYRAEGFDLKPGDDVYIDNTDAFVAAGLGLQYALGRHMQLYSTVAFNRNIAGGKFSLYNSADDDSYLESGSAAIVGANEQSSTPIQIQPNLIRKGPLVSIGIRVDLGGYPQTHTKHCECCGQEIH